MTMNFSRSLQSKQRFVYLDKDQQHHSQRIQMMNEHFDLQVSDDFYPNYHKKIDRNPIERYTMVELSFALQISTFNVYPPTYFAWINC